MSGRRVGIGARRGNHCIQRRQWFMYRRVLIKIMAASGRRVTSSLGDKKEVDERENPGVRDCLRQWQEGFCKLLISLGFDSSLARVSEWEPRDPTIIVKYPWHGQCSLIRRVRENRDSSVCVMIRSAIRHHRRKPSRSLKVH